MKVVILAAGQGSRLGQGDLPKPLTPLISGKSILAQQVETLVSYVPLNDIMVVVGYHKEEIMRRFPDLLYVYSPDYAKENTSKSLLRALKKCREDVLWLNGDVVFHPTVLSSILRVKETAMVVNEGVVGEEEVKYRKDIEGCILEVSKHLEQAQGEALGINYCAFKDLKMLCDQLEECGPTDYFEAAIEKSIEQGMVVRSVVVDQGLCAEVDFPEDLVKANAMIASWIRR